VTRRCRRLLAFKAGDERRHLKHAYGHGVSLDVYWMSPDHVAELIGAAGLVVDARLTREPDARERPVQGRQAFFLAGKPAPTAPALGTAPVPPGA